MNKITTFLLFVWTAALTLSCDFMHDDEIVATAAGQSLSRQEVEALITPGLSPADSIAAAEKIINEWALDRIINSRLSDSLPDSAKDLTRELEEYRKSLLHYRYEQQYVSSRLDTCVTPEQIQAYYEENGKKYALTAPIVRVRIFRLPPSMKERDEICRKLSNGKDKDIEELKVLAERPECAYMDYDGKWINIVDLARGYQIDYGSLLARKDTKGFIVIEDEQGEEVIIYVVKMLGYGKIPPLEYCSGDIREAIIGRRKFELSSGMAADLLKDAAGKGEFEKYELKVE